MTELRIALFTGNYNHTKDGVSLTLNRLVQFLEEREIPVKVFGPTSDEPDIDHVGEFLSVPSIPMPGRPEYRITVGFPDEVHKELNQFKPTLVHIATPDLLGFRAMRYAQSNDIQIVSSYHTHFTSYLEYYNIDVLEVLAWKYLRWFYSQCTHIYVPSPSMAEELRDEGIDEGLRIWARGVNTELFNPDARDRDWLVKQGLNPDDKIVLFVSRLVWEKELQTYVDTIKRLRKEDPSVKALVVGEGPARLELQEMLPEGVFTGFLEGKELARAYASSDLFLFPSHTETFGNVTLEAMACGLPAVVADATGSRSLVDAGENGYIAPPRKPEAFARCVKKILESEEKRQQMGRASRTKALEYSWENVNGALLDHYREALAEEKPALKY